MILKRLRHPRFRVSVAPGTHPRLHRGAESSSVRKLWC